MNEHQNKLTYGASPPIFENATALKREMTDAEKILWKHLRNNKMEGFKFRRQHPIGKFIGDFYCHQKKLVVELDGSVHDTEEARERDQGRTEELQNFGLTIMRFRNEEVFYTIENVLSTIKKYLLTSD